jgi:hypothetical protein
LFDKDLHEPFAFGGFPIDGVSEDRSHPLDFAGTPIFSAWIGVEELGPPDETREFIVARTPLIDKAREEDS